jgi:hypothetical protein
MDLIEQWFYVSPDNGSGTVEITFVVTLALFVVASAKCLTSSTQFQRRRIASRSPWMQKAKIDSLSSEGGTSNVAHA